MRIRHIQLEAFHLDEMKNFYINILFMELVQEREHSFMVQVGDSFITFRQGQEAPYYHFACLMDIRSFADIVSQVTKRGHTLHRGYTSMWEAEQFYFKDPDGNIVEILGTEVDHSSPSSPWIKIVEIGMPLPNIEEIKKGLGPLSNQYNEGSDTFQFYGDQEGVFVLTKLGRPWFPTNKEATLHPITIDVDADKSFCFKPPSLPYIINGSQAWSKALPVTQLRIARPTNQFDDVVRFYQEGLGLKVVAAFEGHQGYKGKVFGLPDPHYQLEFTEHENGSPCPAPTKDNLLVLYMSDRQARNAIVERLAAMGYPSVPPENPYWEKSGVTIEDPDGWRVVLMNAPGL
ncbi:hypothetical protein GCM10011391_09750 [Pullulanibacillus camelliae]|uniref:VOC domain-containing protein n=1 Tax=Pullulanibacillus camelliae TaxID=1707096 RepID=A0A8J2VN43_9BACL|nr:VOC family protein [Pullulanibacillus camelliae]GGE33154.1 hypothetical protein GCM10011391_09750 [Pullulanibacillus camelliae]